VKKISWIIVLLLISTVVSCSRSQKKVSLNNEFKPLIVVETKTVPVIEKPVVKKVVLTEGQYLITKDQIKYFETKYPNIKLHREDPHYNQMPKAFWQYAFAYIPEGTTIEIQTAFPPAKLITIDEFTKNDWWNKKPRAYKNGETINLVLGDSIVGHSELTNLPEVTPHTLVYITVNMSVLADGDCYVNHLILDPSPEKLFKLIEELNIFNDETPGFYNNSSMYWPPLD